MVFDSITISGMDVAIFRMLQRNFSTSTFNMIIIGASVFSVLFFHFARS